MLPPMLHPMLSPMLSPMPHPMPHPRRDPLRGLIHGATVTQVCRFYYLMATGRLISPERSRQMLEYLNAPGIHHKFVHSLDILAPCGRRLIRRPRSCQPDTISIPVQRPKSSRSMTPW